MMISCCITNGLSSLVIYLFLMPGMCCALEALSISGVLWSGINSLSLPILASLCGFSMGKPQPLCGFKALVSLLFQGALCVCCMKSLRSTSSFCVSLLPFFGTGFLTLLGFLLHCFQPTSCACVFCWQQKAWLPIAIGAIMLSAIFAIWKARNHMMHRKAKPTLGLSLLTIKDELL